MSKLFKSTHWYPEKCCVLGCKNKPMKNMFHCKGCWELTKFLDDSIWTKYPNQTIFVRSAYN